MFHRKLNEPLQLHMSQVKLHITNYTNYKNGFM